MEMTVISEFKAGSIKFKNKQLTRSTDKLLSNMNKSKEAFCAAAMELKKIRDDKLYEEDFTDDKGKGSFSRYCEEILGISKSKAGRIIITGDRLLYPEIVEKTEAPYFANFGDTKLSIIAETGKNYEECKDFCIQYGIDETTDQSDIRAAAKEYKESKKPVDNTTTDENEPESSDDNQPKITSKQLKLDIGDFIRENLNELCKKYPKYITALMQAGEDWK